MPRLLLRDKQNGAGQRYWGISHRRCWRSGSSTVLARRWVHELMFENQHDFGVDLAREALRYEFCLGTTTEATLSVAWRALWGWGKEHCGITICICNSVAARVRIAECVRPNVRAKRATTAGRQARAVENVPRTARPGLVACRWRSA